MKESEKMSKEDIKKMNKKVIFVVVMFLLIAIFIWIGLTIQKMTVLQQIQAKVKELNAEENVYCKITYLENDVPDYSSEFFKKGNTIVLKMREGRTLYKNADTKEAWLINENQKIAGKMIYENVLLDNVPNPGYDYAVGNDEKHIFQNNLIYSLTSSLVSQKLGDTTCYLWNNMGNKVWYNKDNLLVVKANFGTAEENGQKVDISCQYEYSIGTVTDEQVALPDLTNYTVK